MLSRFPDLSLFLCTRCRIKNIDNDAFSNSTKLTRLTLTENHFPTVKASWFKDLTSLQHLKLSDNNIDDIEELAFNRITSSTPLEGVFIYLDGNNLSEVKPDKWVGDGVYVKGLSLSRNNITKIEDRAFTKFPKLVRLDLTENNLTEVRRQSFSDEISPYPRIDVRGKNIKNNTKYVMFN